jgi:hypothetical protein
MKKYVCVLCLSLGACQSVDMGRLDPDSVNYPEQPIENVRVVSHEVVSDTCHVVSLAISEPEDTLGDIIQNLREEGAKIGGNLVHIDTLAYMPSADSSEEKYATATVYLCE